MNICAALFFGLELDAFSSVLGAFIVSVILFIAMMIYYKIRVLKLEQYVDYLKEHGKISSDVSMIAKKIEEDLLKGEVKTGNFEVEQEDTAIISYQELLKKEKNAKFDAMVRHEDEYLHAATMEKVRPVYSTTPMEKLRPAYDEVDELPNLIQTRMPQATPEVRASSANSKNSNAGNPEFLTSLVSLRKNLR